MPLRICDRMLRMIFPKLIKKLYHRILRVVDNIIKLITIINKNYPFSVFHMIEQQQNNSFVLAYSIFVITQSKYIYIVQYAENNTARETGFKCFLYTHLIANSLTNPNNIGETESYQLLEQDLQRCIIITLFINPMIPMSYIQIST